MYQNRATLIGFLGKNAEVKTTRNRAAFTVLSLATKRTWKDQESGERRSETTWHRCIVWGRLGEFAATLSKGAHIQVEGDIRHRAYTGKSGNPASITELRVTSISKLDRATKGEEPGGAA
jgi:single-strand DNA-binding protein